MCFVPLVVIAALTPPGGFDVECKGWPNAREARVDFEAVLLDGTHISFDVHFFPGATGETIASDVRLCFDDPRNLKTRAFKLSPTAARVTGAKAPILFLTATSKQWAPTVRPVPGPPPGKK